jgi:hypothetical protein
MTTLKAGAFVLCLLALRGPAAAATELAIHFTALQRILAEQVFTQEGRKYVRGTPAAKCSFAYLEKPEVRGDNGILNVKARFTGRSALDMFGRCIGLGGSFDALITATPYYQDGVIRLKDVRVASPGRDSYYIRRVRAALAESLRSQFSYRVVEDAKKILEQPRDKAPYRQELVKFHVPAIRVTSDALVLTLEFTLAVK